MEKARNSNRSFDMPQRQTTRVSVWRAQGKILGACSRRLFPTALYLAHPWARRQRSTSCIRAVVLALLMLGVSSGVSHAGDLSLLINGKAFHIDPPAGKQFNERNWGAGIQYDFDPQGRNKNWIPLAMVSGFQDSYKNPSYYAGGGLMRRFVPFSSLNSFHVDTGVVAFFMTREDYKDNHPFFGMLPVLSVGTQRVSLNLTYVPKVHPKMVQLVFIQLKVALGRNKNEH